MSSLQDFIIKMFRFSPYVCLYAVADLKYQTTTITLMTYIL